MAAGAAERRRSRLSSSSGSDSDRSRSNSRSSSRSRSRSSSAGSKSSRSAKSGSRSKSSSRSRSRSRSSSSSSGSAKGASDKSNASSSSAGSGKGKKLVKASDRKASTALLSKLSDSSDSEEEREAPQKKKQKSPEPEPVKPKKKETVENNDHFDDGYDEDLIGDDEDRQWLEDLTEKEREEELFKRAERREELKKRFEITQKLKLQNKDKVEVENGKDKSDGEVSSDSDGSPIQKKKKISREEQAEGGRVKGYEVKHASKFSALSQLKAQREEKVKKEQERKEKEAKRKKESSGSDNSDMEKLAKKSKKSKAADIYSSSSDSDNKNERRRSSSSSSSSSSGSGSESSGESDTERHSSKKIVKKAANVEDIGDLEKIRLSRFKLDKFVHLPIFKKTVLGCFVKINIGINPEKGAPMYRVAEIIDVVETAKVYDVMAGKNRTNMGLKLKHGKNSRVYRASFVSNQPFTESEFNGWKNTCISESVDLPTHSFVEEKVKQIDYALSYRFSNSDVEKILANKEKFTRGPKNLAVYKAKLQRDRINAINEGNQDLVDELDRKLAEHEEKAERADAKRSGTLSTVSLINDRNRKGNIDRAMKGLKEEELRIKKEGYSQDPFTRRKTRPVLAMPKDADEKMTTELLMKLEQEKKAKVEKENIIEKEYVEETDEKPLKKDVPDVFNAHDFDIDIDINPADAQVSMTSMGVRPVANTNVQPLGPTKKSIKLEEYKKRKGII